MRAALRALVITAGVLVIVWSALAIHLADWPIYVTYVVLAVFLFRFWVEALPDGRLTLPVPGLALNIGFLYLAGPLVIVLRLAEPIVVILLRAIMPRAWRHWVPAPTGGAGEIATVFWIKNPADRLAAAAEWANYALGLAARWAVVSLVIPGQSPAAHPGAVLLAEGAGYLTWGVLAWLPIYAYGPLIPPHRGLRVAGVRTLWPAGGSVPLLDDLQLIFSMVLTPFVFLILYGYRAHGLVGAAAWSLATLGLHFMLKLLTERRVAVEAQNARLEALNRELAQRERLSAIGKMSSVISHQMLQQLGVIGIYADLIRQADG